MKSAGIGCQHIWQNKKNRWLVTSARTTYQCIPYSRKISQSLNFVFFAIWVKWQKFIHEIFSFMKFSLVYCFIVNRVRLRSWPCCIFGSVEVPLSLPDPKRHLSSTVRPQAIDSANKKVSMEDQASRLLQNQKRELFLTHW